VNVNCILTEHNNIIICRRPLQEALDIMVLTVGSDDVSREAMSTVLSVGIDAAQRKGFQQHAGYLQKLKVGVAARNQISRMVENRRIKKTQEALAAHVSSGRIIVQVDDEAELNSVAYWEQGSESLSKEDRLKRRRSLKSDEGVRAALHAWLVAAKANGFCTEAAEPALQKDGYHAIMLRFHKILLDDFDYTMAKAMVEKDWVDDLGDSNGSDGMPQEVFFSALFELADVWTPSIDAAVYAAFLRRLLTSCVDQNGNLRSLQSIKFDAALAVELAEGARLAALDEAKMESRSHLAEAKRRAVERRNGAIGIQAQRRRQIAAREDKEREQAAALIQADDRAALIRRAAAAAAAGKGGELSDAEREAAEIAERIADLKRRQALGQLTPEEEEELRRLEARKKELDAVIAAERAAAAAAAAGKGGELSDAEREAAEIAERIADLKRRQALGQLTPEEEEELRRLEARMKELEAVIAAERAAADALLEAARRGPPESLGIWGEGRHMGDGPLGWHGLTVEELAALTPEELAALMRRRPPKIAIAYRTRPLLVSRMHFGSPIPLAPRPSQKWAGVHIKPASAAGMVGQRNVAFKPLRPSKMYYVTPAAAHIVASRLHQERSDVAPRGMWRQIMSEYGPKTLASTPSPSPREASRPTTPWDLASTLEARALWRGHVAPNGIHPPSPRARSPSARSISLFGSRPTSAR